jgi:hypothetical protein
VTSDDGKIRAMVDLHISRPVKPATHRLTERERNYTSRLGSNGTAASGPRAANKTAEQNSAKKSVNMIVNGQARTITVEPRMTLLDSYQLHAKRRS